MFMKKFARRRSFANRMTVGVAAILAASLISAGCDSASFVPPPPPELRGAVREDILAPYDGAGNAPGAGQRAYTGTPSVELILAGPAEGDRAYFQQLVHSELGQARIRFRLTQPDTQHRWSPGDLAGAIRAAVRRRAAGLIVEPSDEAVVVSALYDAVDKGIGVILLDRPVPARAGKVIPRVEFTEFAEVGRQIVSAVAEVANKRKATKPGRIVLLHHRSDDPYLERSFESLLRPAKATGKPVETLEFTGDGDQGMALLRKSLEADPNLDIVLADDEVGVFVGFRIHIECTKSGRHEFLLAGYASDDYRIVTFLERMYALGDRSVASYASQSCRAIRSLMEGKPVADVVRVPVTFTQRDTPSPPPTRRPPAERADSPKG
jgi:ABC-type sugar transport system substrate-binding protein